MKSKRSHKGERVASNDLLGHRRLAGWVVVHPDGTNEVAYWNMPEGPWWPDSKNRRKRRRNEWMDMYRPGCRLVRAVLRPNDANEPSRET